MDTRRFQTWFLENGKTDINPDGVSFLEVVKTEKENAKECPSSSRLPTPECEEWKAIKKYYNLPDPVKINDVLSEVTLPRGWKIMLDPKDPSGRESIILDHENKKIGNVFVKLNHYDSWGYISFIEERLKELGIVEK